MTNNETEICCKFMDIQKWIPEFQIDDAKRIALCFRESLLICLKNEFANDTNPIGGYCILVEAIGPQACEFLVHVQSSMSIDDHFGGSKVISSATSKFNCLEEKRTEFVYEDDGLHEKTIFIGAEDNFYHVKLTRTCPCDTSAETKQLPCQLNSRLISEGINILLMRYLTLINYEGTLSFDSITIDGDITTSNYTCTPAEQMEIDDHFLNVYTIERKMFWKDGTVHTIRTYLTSGGRILRHNWLDVPYFLKLNPLADPKVTSEMIKIKMPLRDHWLEDIEMLSKYLDMKYSKKAEQAEYLADHPEIKKLIADYTQTLLVGNPHLTWTNILPIILKQNVIDFTIQHFKAFDKDPKNWETSCMLEETDDIDVMSQLAKEKSDVECHICGFCIDCSMLQETSSRTSAGECAEEDSDNSIRSVGVKSSDITNRQEKNTSTSKSSTSDSSSYSTLGNDEQKCISETGPQLKRTCDQCQTIVRTCHANKSSSKCPGCLKVFNICAKCSVIDQILQRLKENM